MIAILIIADQFFYKRAFIVFLLLFLRTGSGRALSFSVFPPQTKVWSYSKVSNRFFFVEIAAPPTTRFSLFWALLKAKHFQILTVGNIFSKFRKVIKKSSNVISYITWINWLKWLHFCYISNRVTWNSNRLHLQSNLSNAGCLLLGQGWANFWTGEWGGGGTVDSYKNGWGICRKYSV